MFSNMSSKFIPFGRLKKPHHMGWTCTYPWWMYLPEATWFSLAMRMTFDDLIHKWKHMYWIIAVQNQLLKMKKTTNKSDVILFYHKAWKFFWRSILLVTNNTHQKNIHFLGAHLPLFWCLRDHSHVAKTRSGRVKKMYQQKYSKVPSFTVRAFENLEKSGQKTKLYMVVSCFPWF